MAKKTFKAEIYQLVAQIPKGRVMTYGQVAYLCGRPRAARIVGGVAHFGNLELPWHRVVKKDGSLAEGYPGGTEGHRRALLNEGMLFTSKYRLDMEAGAWRPKNLP